MASFWPFAPYCFSWAPVNAMHQSPLGSIFSTWLRRHCRLRNHNKVRDPAGPFVLALPLERVPVVSNHLLGVMAGLVPAIHVFLAECPQERRGCPRRRGPRRVTRRGVIARA